VRRGEIWTAIDGSGYVGKPRPVVIVQDDRFDATALVTVCAFTTDPTAAPLSAGWPLAVNRRSAITSPRRLRAPGLIFEGEVEDVVMMSIGDFTPPRLIAPICPAALCLGASHCGQFGGCVDYYSPREGSAVGVAQRFHPVVSGRDLGALALDHCAQLG
jgi:hypothetical protein